MAKEKGNVFILFLSLDYMDATIGTDMFEEGYVFNVQNAVSNSHYSEIDVQKY